MFSIYGKLKCVMCLNCVMTFSWQACPCCGVIAWRPRPPCSTQTYHYPNQSLQAWSALYVHCLFRLCSNVFPAGPDFAVESLCEAVGDVDFSSWPRAHSLSHAAGHNAVDSVLSWHGRHQLNGQGLSNHRWFFL